MSNTLNNDLREALRNAAATIKDPGANGTITFPGNKAIAIVELGSAGTNAFSSAADVPIGSLLIVMAQASVTVNSVVLADGEFAEFFVTKDSAGAHQWSLRSIANTSIADTFADGAELSFGTGDDAQIGWQTADADNHGLVLALGDTSQMLHITDKAAIGTDWAVTSPTHPTIYVHSNTTPITDYLAIGQHDGTTAIINNVGGTTLSFQIDGTAAFTATATTVKVADSGSVTFGTGNDIVMAWDGTDFDVTQATANSSIKWGVDGAGIDQVWYGDTASNSMTWDQSADALVFTAAATITGAGSTFGMFTPSATQEENPAAGAISVTTFATQLDTAGAEAFTLAAGGQKGQLKFIHMTVDGGDATLTATGFTSIVFSNIGDAVLLRWDGAAWVCLLRMNMATAAITTPVLNA